jgi:hypothetical protein
MLLYHGTNEDVLPKIQLQGLKPRGKRKSQWEHYPSRSDMVYLTTAYAFYFAMNTKGKGRAMVLEIDSDQLVERKFFPDEDFIAQVVSNVTKQSLEKVHGSIKDTLKQYQQYWRLSIENLGNCSYQGTIHLKTIKRMCLFDVLKRSEIAFMAMDPIISLINYRFCKEKYTGLIAWMFGDRADIPSDIVEVQDIDENSEFAKLQKTRKEFWEKESKNQDGIEVFNFNTTV